jgi:hypothetical protein
MPNESIAEPACGACATATCPAGQSIAGNVVPAVAAPSGPVVVMAPRLKVKLGEVPEMTKDAQRN